MTALVLSPGKGEKIAGVAPFQTIDVSWVDILRWEYTGHTVRENENG